MKRWGRVLRGAAWSRKFFVLLSVNVALLSPVFLQAQSPPPLAIFANDANLPAGSKVISMSSGHSTITGRIHCNSDIDVSGTANYFRTGVVEYVTGIHPTPNFQGKVTLQSCPVVTSTVQPFPVTYQQSDFAPGGSAALAAQAAGEYYHIQGDTHLTAFMSNGVLRKGLYYIEGNLNLSQGSLHGQVTLVATGTIIISGPGESWQPYTQCLLAFSSKTLPYNNSAINISSGSSQWSGVLFAPNGGVQISGSGNTVTGGALLGLGVQLTGGSLNLTGIDFGTCSGTPTNQAPVVYAGPDQAVNLHTNTVTVTLAGSVTDDGLPAGGTLESSWSLVSGPSPVTFVDPTRTNTMVTLTMGGIYVLRLTADDSALTNSDDVIVTFDRTNNPPVAYDQSVTNLEETTAAIVLEGSDPDGDPLTFFITSQPSFGTLSGTPSNVFYTPKPGYFGSDSFTFKVSDGSLESGVATVSITNLHVNHAPLAEAQAVTTLEETATNITLTGSDADGEALTFTIAVGPTNGTLVGSGSTYTYTPNSNYFGADAFSFTANDGITNSAPGLVNITVTPVDKPPLVDAGPDQLISLPQNTTQLAGTVVYEDFPDTVDTVTWSQLSGPGTATFSDASNETSTVTFSQSGVYELQLVASDSFLSGTNQVRIIVNAPPTVTAGPSQTNTLPGSITLSGVVTDDGLPTNGILSVAWSEVSGPGTAIFANDNDTNTTVEFSQSGIYTLRLTADDGAASASSDVTVLINSAPIVDAGSSQLITNLQTALDGTVFDDGLPSNFLHITWSQVSGPGTAAFADSNAPVTTVTFSQPGVYVLQLSADDSLAIGSNQVTISVDGPPVVTASGDPFVLFPGTANLTATATNDDDLPAGSVLTYGWNQVSGPGTVTFVDASALSTTASFSTSGVYVVQFQASDTLLSAVTNLTITVDQAPVVNAGPDQVVSLSTGAGLHGSVSDDGIPLGVPVVVEWVKVSGPGVVRFGNINAVDTTATFSVPGIYTLELVASDTISSSSDTVTITVTPPGVNQPPSVYAGPNQTIGGTNIAKLAGVVTDDNFFGTGFLYSWWKVASGPGTVSFANSNAPATTATFSTAGTYVLTLSATDSQYTNSSQVTITIYPTNQPPTVNPGPNQSITTSITTLAGQVHDDGLPQGSTLTAHWSQVSGPGTAFFAVPSYAATTVSFPQPGTYVLQLTASDTQYSVSSNVTISVQFNQAPVVNAGTDQEIVNTNVAVLRGQASDDGLPTGSTLTNTWSLVNGPSTATFGNIHATNTTVTFGDQGAYQIRLSATDGQLTSFDDVTIIVASSNSIPYQASNTLYRFVQTESTNFFVTNLDESTYTNGQAGFGNFGSCPLNNATFIHTIWPGLNGGARYLLIRKHFFIPPGTTNLDMGFTVDNNALIYINGILITPTNIHQLIINNGSNSRFNATTHYWDHDNCPAYNDLVLSGIGTNIWSPGNNLLTVQVFDDGGQAFYDNRISPNAPSSVLLNKPPVPQVNTNVFVVYPSMATLTAIVQDDGLPLNGTKLATWSMVNGPGTVTFSRPTSSFAISNDVSTLAAFSAEGTYTLMLQANDSDLTGAAIVRVTVSSISNQPPVVSAGSDQTISLSDSAALNGVATDDGFPFGTLSTYWSAASGPGNVYFTTLNGTQYVAFDAAGDYVLQFNANDGATTSSATVTIHVLPPISRSLRISTSYPPQTDVSIGADLSGQVFDDGLPPGSTLTVQWSTLSGPAPAVFSQVSNNFPAVSAHADFTAAGNYVLRLTASDGQLTANADMAITVTDLYSGNRAPVVDAGPATSATTAAPIVLHGSASDDGRPVGGTLATLWTQLSGPGTVLFANAAVTNTTATFSAEGVYVLRLTATDGQLTNSADVTVIVTGQPLIVYAGPDATTFRQISLNLVGIVLDGTTTSNLTFQWGKISGPGTVTFTTVSNTTLNATTWLPVVDSVASATAKFSASGTYVLQLAATDSHITNADTLMVTVSDGTNTAPVVNAGPPQTILLGTVAALHPVVTDDGLPNGTLTLSWSKVSGPGTVTFSKVSGNYYAAFSAAGVYDLRLVASDGALSGSNDVVITVFATVPSPDAEIFAPQDSVIVTAPTNIIGTASSLILASYQVRYRLAPPATGDSAIPTDTSTGWTTLTTGSTSVVSNTLAVFDPTMLLNGIYEIQVVASDLLGNTSFSDVTTVIVDRNLKIGQFTISFNDLSVPVPGLPLQITRTYDSRAAAAGIQGDFGTGWTLDIHNVRLQKNRNLGANWEEETSGGLFPTYELDPIQDRIVSIIFPDGNVQKFHLDPNPDFQPLIPIEFPQWRFTPIGNTRGTLEPASVDEIDGRFMIVVGEIPGTIDLYDLNYFSVNTLATTEDLNRYPTLFRYTSPEGYRYLIDEVKGLQSVTDPNGNTLLIGTNGIAWTNSVAGTNTVSVAFQRDNAGRITNIVDVAGNAIRYAYSTNGNLVAFTDRVGQTNGFSYTNLNFPHYLTSITDARGLTPVRNEYDANGRLVGNIDGFGNVIGYGHDISHNREYVTNRLGQVTASDYDDHGNIIHVIDANGAETFSSYDDNGNLLTTTDALGRTNSFTYDDLNDRLTVTDPLGHVTRFTYGVQRRVTSVADARGNSITNTFDAKGNLLSLRDPLGNVTRFSYDDQGSPVAMTNALGQVMQFAYDEQGHLVGETDVNGHTNGYIRDANGNLLKQTTTRTTPSGLQTLSVQFFYDAQSRLTNSVFPDGSSAQTLYNALGKPAATIDQLGRQTLIQYDELGRIAQATYPDGSVEASAYDAEGRRIASTNRLGQVTQYFYDNVGRLIRTLMPDGTSTTNYFDPAGQLIVSSDAKGNSTFYGYDAAGRSIAVTNALGQVSQSFYDAGGNLTNAVDALGRSTRFVYDSLNRRVQTIFPDGTTQQTFYDILGRRFAETDQANKTTWFGYDALGRLTSVTNALGYVTTYAYDELGQQISQTDANNHTTTFEYDSMGRRVKRTLPGNQVETYAYSFGGLLTNRTDFNGYTMTYQYDVMNRLLAKIPDGRRGEPNVTYGYNTLGLRTNMTDASGSTAYSYDGRNRLVQKTKSWTGQASSVSLNYAYDLNGNLTNIVSSDANGVNVAYAYDELNRLAAVGDARLGVTAYNYDNVGNLQGCTYPNFVHAEYQYDALNRLTNLVSDRLGTAIANFAYAVGPAGNRTNATEQLFASTLNAQAKTINRVYTYDSIYRLTGETINGTPSTGSASYNYDPAGNRLSRGITGLPLLSQSFSFDPDDRLNTDTYDANGNTLVGSGFGQSQADEYDFENRLVTRHTPGSTVHLTYDGDGNRVSKTVVTATNSITTLFVVDALNPSGYAQVLEEHVSLNSQISTLNCIYIYGHTLISQQRLSTPNSQPSTSFYGYDGHNDVRYLTDANANVTDTYDYDAFGNLVARSGSTVNNYLFTGEQYDADLGLYYLRARYHNTDTGRFWSEDSFEGDGTDPASLHKYTYCGNNPINSADPTGQMTLSEAMTGTAVGSMLGGALINAYVGAVSRFAGAFFGGAGWQGAGAAALNGLDEDVESGLIGGLAGYGIGKAAFWAVGKFAPYLLNTGPVEALVAYARESTVLNKTYAAAKLIWNKLDAAVIDGSEAAINSARAALSETYESIIELTGRLYRIGKAIGLDSEGRIFGDLAAFGTGNPSAAEVVLGKWDGGGASSYLSIARARGATYFSLGDFWGDVATVVGEDNMWSINEAFLEQQVNAGKTFLFSHDPNVATGYFQREVNYLKGIGFKFIQDGSLWRAIR